MIVWKLDELLRYRGVKGRDLAKRMAIGENYLSRVRHEIPDRLSLSLLDALCRELDCGITDLLEYRPGEQPPLDLRTRRRVTEPTILDKRTRPMHVPLVVPDDMLVDDSTVIEPLLQPEAPTASPPAQPGAFLKPGALQSRLDQLRRRRGPEV